MKLGIQFFAEFLLFFTSCREQNMMNNNVVSENFTSFFGRDLFSQTKTIVSFEENGALLKTI